MTLNNQDGIKQEEQYLYRARTPNLRVTAPLSTSTRRTPLRDELQRLKVCPRFSRCLRVPGASERASRHLLCDVIGLADGQGDDG